MQHLFLGIDIGGTKIAAGLVTKTGQVIAQDRCATPASDGRAAVLAATIHLARRVLDQSPMPVQGIGIGTGGQVDADKGVIVSATDLLPGWAGTQIQTALEEEFGLTVSVDNDVNALALGEGRFGAGRGRATVAFLALGTGVGGALLLQGRLHHGAHWTGGEFGHLLLTMDPQARRDAGGHQGTLEAYVSGSGLVQTWREITGDFETPRIGEEVAAEAKENPEGTDAQAITRTGEYLGYGLVTLTNLLDPDCVIIGGGLAALGEHLLAPARSVLRERALPGPAQCPILIAELGTDAALVGAASLAMTSPAKRNP